MRGERIAILAGAGGLRRAWRNRRVAELLGAPMVKALLGKAMILRRSSADDRRMGLLGTRASQEAFDECDTLLIVGSTFPYVEYYPKPRQARGIQIDRDPSRIGLRFPVEVGLVGDARYTLKALIARAKAHADRSFLKAAQQRKQEWTDLLERAADSARERLTPRPAGARSRAPSRRRCHRLLGFRPQRRRARALRECARRSEVRGLRNACDHGLWGAVRHRRRVGISGPAGRGIRG